TPHTLREIDESEVEYKDLEVRDINSIQFYCAGVGIFLKWEGEFINVASEILALPNNKRSWNGWWFDNTHIRYHLGKDAIKGLNIDCMMQWKHANMDFGSSKRSPIGLALQFAGSYYALDFPAWKHKS